jgi:hypothetical protein
MTSSWKALWVRAKVAAFREHLPRSVEAACHNPATGAALAQSFARLLAEAAALGPAPEGLPAGPGASPGELPALADRLLAALDAVIAAPHSP